MKRRNPYACAAAGAAAVVVGVGGLHLKNLVEPHLVPKELTKEQSDESYKKFLECNQVQLTMMLEGRSDEEITSWEIRYRDLRKTTFLAWLREGRRGACADYLLKKMTKNNRIIHASVWVKKGDVWIEIEFGPAGINLFVDGRDDLPAPMSTERKVLHPDLGHKTGEKRKRDYDNDVKPQTWAGLACELAILSKKMGSVNYGLLGYNCCRFAGDVDMFLGSGCLNNQGVNAQAEEMKGVLFGLVHAGARVGQFVTNAVGTVANTAIASLQAAAQNPALAATAFVAVTGATRWNFI